MPGPGPLMLGNRGRTADEGGLGTLCPPPVVLVVGLLGTPPPPYRTDEEDDESDGREDMSSD